MKKFELTIEDMQAVKIAKNNALHFLQHPKITPKEVNALENALYALDRLPLVTPGAYSEFGIVYRAGTKEFNEMHYIDFRISESAFEISEGGNVYDIAVGSDHFSVPGWTVETSGYRNAECDLYELENSINEYLNLGADISASDESELKYE